MIPKVGSVISSVIRMFKFNKGRVKVGTTLWFNLFGSLEVPLNKHRLDRATVWIEAKLRVSNFSVLNTRLGHQFSQNLAYSLYKVPLTVNMR